MKHPSGFLPSSIVVVASLLATSDAVADDLRERLKDANGVQTDLWVYNDIPQAMA